MLAQSHGINVINLRLRCDKIVRYKSAVRLLAVVLGCVMSVYAGTALADPIQTTPPAPQSDAAPSELHAQFERLHKIIKPQPDEWQFAQIPWVSTIAEARKKAAAEGKPLFIWYMVGEPLGQC